MSFILGLLASLLERFSLDYWRAHKENEVQNVQNKVAAASDADVAKQLRDNWERK
jgi:hypothetical protein